jgi:hypothetical protein
MAKLQRKTKIVLWVTAGLALTAAFLWLVIYALSVRAISDFRDQATQQLNDVVNGQTTGLPVTIRSVWLANNLNGNYKRVAGLANEYQQLLSNVKNYVMTRNIHNDLVKHYNSGIKGDKPLNGDLLKTVNQYQSVVKSRFPDQTGRIQSLENLSDKITSSTDFDDVSAEIDAVLHSNDQWLADMITKLNINMDSFRQKIN